MYQDNVLTYRNLRYLKWCLAFAVACIAWYIWDRPPIRPGGGTWLGYTLGIFGALIILVLLSFGLRKRAYKSNLGSVKGWLSAHIYLGLTLVIIATLHAAFHFAWNIHTLAYILTLAVVATGIWGVEIYLRYPTIMSALLNGRTLEQCAEAVQEIDDESRKIVQKLSPELQKLIVRSAEAPIFDYFWQRYFGKHRSCKTAKAVKLLTRNYSQKEIQQDYSNTMIMSPAQLHASMNQSQQEALYKLQVRRQIQINQIRAYLRLKGWAELWLLFHVPLSFGLLAVLIAHIISVFFYW